jgi:two-component system, OmpR family, sensor histidine kinase KdpD
VSSRARGPIFIAAAIVVAVGAATGLVWLLEETFGFGNASPAYLLAVTGVAVVLGTWPAVGTAILAFLAYNFLFTHPRFTFIVADSAQLLNLVLLLVVGVVVGQLAGTQRHRAEEAERREREARVLFQISRALATRGDTTTALNEIVAILRGNTGLAAVWIAIRSPSGTERAVTPVPDPGPRAQEPQFALQRRPGDEPARWMLVRPPAARDAGRGPDYRVSIEAAGADLGSIWARTSAGAAEPPGHETRMLAAASDQIGLALEQDRLRREATSAELARESEAMKSALLESVSHDLRTPLAAIRAAAGELLEGPGDEPSARDRALTIDAEATRMDRLVGNLLDISRIEAGGLHVDAQPYALEDLVADSLRRFRGEIAGRLETAIDKDLPYVSVDAILLDQAVANVLDNSLRYAPGARLRISATVEGEWVALHLEDDGPGVPESSLPHLFEKFYRVERSRDPARRGTGIGLAVVRGLVRAMHGEVDARKSSMGGLAVTMRLPIASVADLEDA